MSKKPHTLQEALAEIAADTILTRTDQNNPKCPGCDRRFKYYELEYEGPAKSNTAFVCCECADQQIFLDTGCRFGLVGCHPKHTDCHTSEHKKLLCQE